MCRCPAYGAAAGAGERDSPQVGMAAGEAYSAVCVAPRCFHLPWGWWLQKYPVVCWPAAAQDEPGPGVSLQSRRGEHSEAWGSKMLGERRTALLCDFAVVLLCRSLLHHCKIVFKNGMRAWFGFGKYFYHYYD